MLGKMRNDSFRMSMINLFGRYLCEPRQKECHFS